MKLIAKIPIGAAVSAAPLFLYGMNQVSRAGWSHGFGPFEGTLTCLFAVAVIMPVHILCLSACAPLVRKLSLPALVMSSLATPWVALGVFALCALTAYITTLIGILDNFFASASEWAGILAGVTIGVLIYATGAVLSAWAAARIERRIAEGRVSQQDATPPGKGH